MHLKQVLVSNGLDKNEILTYTALLDLGYASFSDLEKNTGLKRPTLYYKVVPELIKLGLVSETVIGKRRSLMANDLKGFYEKKKQDFAEFEKIIPEISSIVSGKNLKPRIYFYEGVEGVKQVWLSHLQEKTEILEFVGIENMHEELEKYISQYYIQERVRRKIPVKMLVACPTKTDAFNVKSNVLELREVRFVNKERLDIPACLDVYGDNVSITLIRKDSGSVGMIIKSKEIARMLRSLFNFVWTSKDSIDL